MAALYAAAVGPVSDVHATMPGDGSVNSAIRKAGWKALLLVGAVTLLSRDLNVVYLGGGMIIYEHATYLHADMASPSTGEITVTPQSYQPAGASLSVARLGSPAMAVSTAAVGAIGAGPCSPTPA